MGEDIKKTLKYFFDNTTVHACNFFTMDHISIFEKIFWGLVNIVTITTAILWIQYTWVWYMGNTTFVNFDGTIPVNQVQFPGVAICNINRISKKRVYEFAKELSPYMKNKNLSGIMEDIKLLANLQDYNRFGQERLEKFQEILDKYDNKFDYNDPSRRIKELTTPCTEILQKCKWEGKYYPCEELFLPRMTFDGTCCVFNYIRPRKANSHFASHEVPTKFKVAHGAGKNHGLEVELNNDLEDYFYTSLETIGYKVHIFHVDDFPDVLSGSLNEFIVGVNRHILMSMEVDVIQSTSQIRAIPIQARKCMFDTEAKTSFGNYKQSDCFVECKLRSMQALCNCIPYVMPINFNSSKYATICTLTDIPCLNQYYKKWFKYYPRGVETEGILDLEKHDSLNCDCLPTCNGVSYNVYTNTVPLEDKEKRNTTIINIYFIKGFGSLYKIDMTYTWFELLSSFGGLLSLIMGLSIISIIEVLVLLFKIVFYSVCSLYYQAKL